MTEKLLTGQKKKKRKKNIFDYYNLFLERHSVNRAYFLTKPVLELSFVNYLLKMFCPGIGFTNKRYLLL